MHGSLHTCDRCQTRFSFVASSDWYYSINDYRLHISVQPAWCFKCSKLRSAEYLPSIDALKHEISKLANKRTKLGTRLAFPKKLEIARIRLDWRLHRLSPPRCIWCGGIDLQILPIDLKTGLLPFVHPGCLGTISFTQSVLGSASPTLFTPEGLRHEH
jgi:hypothetical protein